MSTNMRKGNTMQSRFKKVIVIGYGKIASDMLRYVAERQTGFGYRALCVEYELHGISSLRTPCGETDADYAQVTDKKKVTELLLAEESPTLVISAGNNYLFPQEVVEKRNFEIINFHSALLPKYPGRNAQSWAIYEGETVSGATWHYVTADVDSGAIIEQRETPVGEDIRAYELTQDIMVKAFEAFQNFYEELLIRHIEGRPQPRTAGARRIYYSWELPGGGMFEITDSVEIIYRMLRSMDYGKADIFPPVRVKLTNGREAEVLRYRKAPKKHLKDGQRVLFIEEEKRIYFALDAEYELVIKING